MVLVPFHGEPVGERQFDDASLIDVCLCRHGGEGGDKFALNAEHF